MLDRKTASVLFSAFLFFTIQSPAGAVTAEEQAALGDNPFLKPYNTPFDVPPFDAIKNAHYLPAFTEGMKRELAEIEALVNDPIFTLRVCRSTAIMG